MKEILRSAYRRVYGLLGHRGLGRVPLISHANRFVTGKLNKNPEFVEFEGNRIYLLEKDSAISNALPLLGIVEPTTTEFFKKNIKEGDVVVDIGANIGYYTLLFSKKVGKTGKVFAFEPDPRNIPVLKKNVEANGCSNVTIVEKAVCDSNEGVIFYLGGISDCSSICPRGPGNEKEVHVESTTLDRYFEKTLEKISLIKMDTEGAEAFVFKGMQELVRKNPDVMIVAEIAPMLMEQGGSDPKEYLEGIERLGFEIYDIDEGKRKIEKHSVSELLGKYGKTKDSGVLLATNLLFVKKTRTVEGI